MYIDIYLYIADTQVVCIQDINLGVKRLSRVARRCCFSSLGWRKAGDGVGAGSSREGPGCKRCSAGDPLGTPLVQDWALPHPPLRLELMGTAGRVPGDTAGCCPGGVWPHLLYLRVGPAPPGASPGREHRWDPTSAFPWAATAAAPRC